MKMIQVLPMPNIKAVQKIHIPETAVKAAHAGEPVDVHMKFTFVGDNYITFGPMTMSDLFKLKGTS